MSTGTSQIPQQRRLLTSSGRIPVREHHRGSSIILCSSSNDGQQLLQTGKATHLALRHQHSHRSPYQPHTTLLSLPRTALTENNTQPRGSAFTGQSELSRASKGSNNISVDRRGIAQGYPFYQKPPVFFSTACAVFTVAQSTRKQGRSSFNACAS
jgi:hypothetical protein